MISLLDIINFAVVNCCFQFQQKYSFKKQDVCDEKNDKRSTKHKFIFFHCRKNAIYATKEAAEHCIFTILIR